MGAAQQLDPLLWAVGGLVSGGALLLLSWAIFSDRAKGRRRCPRCWYDMAGVPGLTCPECGRSARSERQLAKTRRRGRWAILALFLIAASGAASAWPVYRDHGWVGLVPSTVLVFLAPADPDGDSKPWSTPPGFPARARPLPPNQWTLGLTPRAMTLGERLSQEAWTRLQRGRLAAWQSRTFLDRCFERAGTQGPWTIRFLDRWPLGEPVLAQVHQNNSIPSLIGTELELSIGGAEARRWDRWPRSPKDAAVVPGTPQLGSGNRLHIRLFLGEREIYRRTEPLPCVIVPKRADAMRPVATREANTLVQSAIELDLAEVEGQLNAVVRNREDPAAWERIDFAVVFRADVLADGVVVATSVAREELLWPIRPSRLVMPMDWTDNGAARFKAARHIEIRLRGTPEDAAAHYFRWPFGWPDPECWVGEIQSTWQRILP